ncbi:alpha/beta fold hydrolase [Pseudarthrobacter sulfonivorans]|uniref:alpha/beta fold hydrolase n=1 Tax=Pseudarthrobacter sulfonivorans TaxID=121292 RepID=UPI00210753D1|nr:alpha/beta hydrolase [Pseudarthrobacter sulfonivorans]
MKLSDGRDIKAGGLIGRIYASVAPAAGAAPAPDPRAQAAAGVAAPEAGVPAPRRTFVLLHGIGVSHRYLARLHRELAADSDVYSFDLPGFGDAPRPRRQVPVGEYAAFVSAALAEAGVRSCVVVGHSMGTQHAVELALQEPDVVDGVVLMGPVVDPRRRSVARQALALTRDAMFSESLSANAVVFSDYFRAGPRWYFTELPVMMEYPVEARVPGVSQPVLVLRGSKDPVAGRKWCQRLAALAPQGSLTEIAGHGHVFQHTATGPAAAAITGWARSVERPGT